MLNIALYQARDREIKRDKASKEEFTWEIQISMYYAHAHTQEFYKVFSKEILHHPICHAQTSIQLLDKIWHTYMYNGMVLEWGSTLFT